MKVQHPTVALETPAAPTVALETLEITPTIEAEILRSLTRCESVHLDSLRSAAPDSQQQPENSLGGNQEFF